MIRKVRPTAKAPQEDRESQVLPLPRSVLARLAGAPLPLLPGESETDYREGLLEAFKELGASTHLQIYLAEKIFDCLWWMRRLEAQKNALIISRMADLLKYHAGDVDVRGMLEDRAWEHEDLLAVIATAGLSMAGLVAKATHLEREALRELDAQVGDRIKALRLLQASYEALVNRRVLIERMHLQNAALKQDINALPSG